MKPIKPKPLWFSNLIAKFSLVLILAVLFTAISLVVWVNVFIWRAITDG